MDKFLIKHGAVLGSDIEVVAQLLQLTNFLILLDQKLNHLTLLSHHFLKICILHRLQNALLRVFEHCVIL